MNAHLDLTPIRIFRLSNDIETYRILTQIQLKHRPVLHVLQLALLVMAQIRMIVLELPVMTLMLLLVLILESASDN